MSKYYYKTQRSNACFCGSHEFFIRIRSSAIFPDRATGAKFLEIELHARTRRIYKYMFVDATTVPVTEANL